MATAVVLVFVCACRPTTAGSGSSESSDEATDAQTAPSAAKGQKEISIDLRDVVKIELVLIPPGSFTMGSDGAAGAKPAHEVTISKPFYLGKYEVTQEQWWAVMGMRGVETVQEAVALANSSQFMGGMLPFAFRGAKLPVETLAPEQCQEFLERLQAKSPTLKFSLPTEAQWEYACRAGSKGRYCFGDGEKGLGDYAWYRDNSGNKTHEVGSKKPNAWGLYDMHGNVDECCSDWYGEYPSGIQKDPVGPSSGNARVARGGSWDLGPADCRSTTRLLCYPGMVRPGHLGFRVAAEVK